MSYKQNLKQCRECGDWLAPNRFKINTSKTKGTYRSRVCYPCHNGNSRPASQGDIEKARPLRCRCGNRESWVDAIDMYTGSTWHLCKCCGDINPTKRTWQRPDGLMFLDWERVA